MWAYVAVARDGAATVVAEYFNGEWLPFICTNEKIALMLKDRVEEIAAVSGKHIELRQYQNYTVLETFNSV